jgi:PadR family transcriptional regulator, regulatory protein PadR
VGWRAGNLTRQGGLGHTPGQPLLVDRLQSLLFGSRHGHGIATTIQRTSDELLLVDHGSLYPALQRLERAGLITSAWGISDNNRRARFYKLTRAGRKKLVAETGKWEQLVRAVKGVLQARPEEQQA